MRTNVTGIKTTNEGRVRHSKPKNMPASAKYRMRSVFHASTAKRAKREYSETVVLSVIMKENRSVSAHRLPVARTPASQNTRALPNMSAPDCAIASTPRASRNAWRM
jgi:hypothetical protein